MKVAVLLNWFEPGYMAGGPIRSVSNMVNLPLTDIKFNIICNSYDLDKVNYTNITKGIPVKFNERTNAIYHGNSISDYTSICKSLIKYDPDILYLNTLFSFKFFLLPILLLRIGLLHPKKIFLNPRGSTKQEALNIRKFRKQVYLFIIRRIISNRLTLLFANNEEKLRNRVFNNFKKQIISNVPQIPLSTYCPIKKIEGEIRIVSVGRIHPIKNQYKMLTILSHIKSHSQVTYTIIGEIDERNYWNKCMNLIKSLMPNITVNYLGSLPHKNVNEILLQNHLLFSLSESESFGHAIFESLSMGRPILVSNNTPWHSLQKEGIGWDYNITSEQNKILRAIELMINMSNTQFNKLGKNCWQYAVRYFNNSQYLENYQKFFDDGFYE